jgi:hypothetical protein
MPSHGVEPAGAEFGGQIMQDVSLAPSMGKNSAVTGDSWLDASVRPIATWLQDDHMSALGIANTMRIAHAYYSLRFHRQDKWRRSLYREKFAELLEENGFSERPPIQIKDGYAIDTSMALPHLNRILEDAEDIIEERGGVRRSAVGHYRSHFQEMWTREYLSRFPSFLDFATSSGVIATVGDALQSVPVLSSAGPPGIRFMESNAEFDDQPDRPHDSQLFHIDFYSQPNVYVIVLLRDTTHENGPLTFLPRSVSQKVAAKFDYWSRQCPYRMSDEDIYSVADRKDVIEFCGPRGTVLFFESSGCYHFGSRNSIKPRFQLMLGYTGVYRTDFSEVVKRLSIFPTSVSDSRLRKMVLNRALLADW